MDAAYLRSTVNEALVEGLSAMAVALPEDKVEFIGRYLLNYVQRKSAQEKAAAQLGEAESKYAAEESLNDIKRGAEATKAIEEKARATRLSDFLESLPTTATNKQEAMNSVTSFVADYLTTQGAYLAVKRPAGESEALHYYSASPGQEFLVGKKLPKAVEEGDEVAPRQGLSFDAFKIPEVPEEEPVEGEEGAPPKPPPKPQPLVVENCMRDKRLKFFGIPKLGSYLAVPVVYQTLDHVEGVVVGVTEPPPADPENPDAPVVLPEMTYTAAKVPCSILLGLDTVGEYRTFKPHEISTAVSVGDALAATLEAIEAKMFENHVQFLQGHAAIGEAIAAILAAVATEEAAALETVALQLAPPPVDPDAPPADPPVEPEPVPETLKPYSEAVAVLKVWSSEAGLGAPAYAAALSSMQNHVLPAPPAVGNLVFALGLFLGLAPASLKDACGDVTWEALRTVSSNSPSYYFFGPLFSFSLPTSHSLSLPLFRSLVVPAHSGRTHRGILARGPPLCGQGVHPRQYQGLHRGQQCA